MASYKKFLVVAFVSAALVLVPMRDSKAVIPAIIAGWLLEITGGSILVTDLIAGQAGIIAAVMWWDCNKFKFNAPCTSKTPIPAAQAPKPAITVNLKPDAKRENPNPQKFNDPSPNSASPRDVTPKQTIAAEGEAAPSTAQGIPGVPAGPRDLGVLTQAPRTSNVGAAGVDPDVQRAQYNGSVAAGGMVTGIEVVPQQSPAKPKAIPFIAIHTTCAQNTDCMSPLQANENMLRQYNGGRFINTASIDCCTATMRYVSVAYLYEQATEVTLACDPGYTSSGVDATGSHQCTLTDPSKVKKPVDTPCEVLFDPATKVMMTDKSNPACDGLESSKTITLESEDGSQSIEVKANAGNGFDITMTKGDGSKTALDTGVYDPGTGGYVIVHVNITPPPNPDNGLGCGAPGQAACAVEMALDSETAGADNANRSLLNAKDATLKSQLDGIDPNRFQWTFIPNIPTASCANPSLKNPLTGAPVEMDICGGFNKFSFFLNGALGLLCLYGCVRQIQNAMRA